nr:reverse transcriptase domain-containing protein [Tanacetum cinerariifolium]
GNVYQDNIQEYVSQAASANYNQGNTGFRPQMVANQIRPPGFPPVQNNQNNFNRGNSFTQNRGSVSQTDFERYVKANDAFLRNIQSQGQSTQNQCQNIQSQYQTVKNQLANLTDMMSKFMSSNMNSSSGSGTLPGNNITNPKEDLKGITTRSGVAYQGPTIPTPSKVVKQRTEVTKDQVQTLSSQSTAHVQPPVTQSKTSVSEPVVAPVSASMPNLKPSIPYPSRRDNERRREQDNEQIKKFYEIFKDMSYEISFTDALMLMPKFASTFKALIGNKEKLSEMARTPMNEHCSAIILNKLPKKLGDPNFSFLTGHALIDVHKGKLTLRIRNEAITYNLDQTSRYSANYDQMTVNKIDVTDEACEEYSQEVLGFSDVTASGSPTPFDDPIVSPTSPTLTPFGDSDFLLFEEANAFLGLEDDPDSLEFDPSYYDLEGDILMLEAILNSDPAPSLPDHEQFVPSPWVSPVHCVPKKGGFTVVKNEENELIPTRLVTGNEYYCFLDGLFRYFQIPIDPRDQEKTTCPYGTFTYRRVPFGLCNAPGTFKRCMLAIFHDMVEKTMKVFMDDFSVFGNSAKVDVITKLPLPTTVKDAKARLLRWVLLLQEFDFDVLDTKGADNLAADHLSRLENQNKNVLDPKEINETFPLETLSTVTFREDSSALWFADFANYHAGNFIVKGMSS